MNLAKKLNLKTDETVLAEILPTPIFSYLANLLAVVILTADAFFFFWLLGQPLWGRVVIAAGVTLALIIWAKGHSSQKDNWAVLTNYRLFDIVRDGLFSEAISAINLEEIKDIHIKKMGLAAKIFNYGSVFITTDSNTSVIELPRVSSPLKIQELISEANSENGGWEDGATANPDINSIKENFIKVVPNLSEDDICEVQDFLQARLAEIDEQFNNPPETKEDREIYEQ